VSVEDGRGLRLGVAVTAHRDPLPEQCAALEERVEVFLRGLAAAYPELPLQLLTALAEGGDQIAARAALRLGIPVVAVLPLDEEDYAQDFSEGPARDEFTRLLAAAERSIVLPPAPATAVATDETTRRQRQYAQLGVFLSNHCQVLLALWDGKEGRQLGGTGQVVRYHLTGIMPGFDAELSVAELLADNENDLVYHVVCARDRPGGAPAAGLQALEAAWFSSRRDGARSQDLPADYGVLLERLQQFACDSHEQKDAAVLLGEDLLADAPPLQWPSGARLANRLFQAADGLAIHYQRRMHKGLRALYLLAATMGLVFLVFTEFDTPGYTVLLFLALFFAGVGLHLLGDRQEWHRKYLDYRTLAEGLRVQLYWNLAGVVDGRSVDFAYDNFLQQQDVDMGWIRHVMRQVSLDRSRGEVPDPDWVAWVIDDWVGRPGLGRGQLGWYARKESENALRHRRTSLLGRLSLWAGIGIAILLYLLSLGTDSGFEGGFRQTLLVLMGVLPLVAGIRDAYSHKRAEKELIRQYGFMRGVFDKARRLLDLSEDIVLRRRVLRALGEAALDEGAEWLLMHRERPLEHGKL
jgi:hypothetical protein